MLFLGECFEKNKEKKKLTINKMDDLLKEIKTIEESPQSHEFKNIQKLGNLRLKLMHTILNMAGKDVQDSKKIFNEYVKHINNDNSINLSIPQLNKRIIYDQLATNYKKQNLYDSFFFSKKRKSSKRSQKKRNTKKSVKKNRSRR